MSNVQEAGDVSAGCAQLEHELQQALITIDAQLVGCGSCLVSLDLSTSDGGPPAAAPEPLPTPTLVGVSMPASSARASDSGR